MQRRLALAALMLAAPGAPRAQDAPVPRHRVSAAELHRALSARFPVSLQLGGWIALQVSAPALLLDVQRNRLGATLLAQADPSLRPAMPAGEVDVVFSLRYEPGDRSLRAQDSEILAVRWAGMPPQASAALQQAWPAVAREAVGDVVLHRFTQGELALPDAMGLQPQSFTVAQDGLVVGFGPRR